MASTSSSGWSASPQCARACRRSRTRWSSPSAAPTARVRAARCSRASCSPRATAWAATPRPTCCATTSACASTARTSTTRPWWPASPRTKRSPTTEPIEPPRKSNSKQATTTGTVLIAPRITTIASASPVSAAAADRRSGYLRESLNLSASTGVTSAPISTRPSLSSSWSRRRRARRRWWWLHFGHTPRLLSRSERYSTDSQPSHLLHSPSGIDLLRDESPRLMRGGMSFSNQLMPVLPCPPPARRARRGSDA